MAKKVMRTVTLYLCRLTTAVLLTYNYKTLDAINRAAY